MTAESLQEQLRNFDQIATLVRRSAGRETWRAVLADKVYYLHFHLRADSFSSKMSGSLAPLEFSGLKALQNEKIPAIRAVAMLSGFRITDRLGDAVITQGIEPLTRLDQLLQSGQPFDRRAIVKQLGEILRAMGKARLGHRDLRPSSFAVTGGQLILLDAAQVDQRGLKSEHLWNLAYEAEPFATAADRVRLWEALEPDAVVPKKDPGYAARLKSRRAALPLRTARSADWSITYFESFDRVPAWSKAATLRFQSEDWTKQLPALLDGISQKRFTTIKDDASGQVMATSVDLAGQTIDIILKRPRNKFWYRHVLGYFRASRARRGFDRAIDLMLRHLPVEVPLVVADKRRFGHVQDCIAIYERVPGETLDRVDLAGMSAPHRQSLFWKLGRILRKIEETGLAHTDAKSTNWIIFPDPTYGPQPVLIDAYGLRRLTSFLQLFGIQRLLKAMRFHPQYTPDDSRNLCLGFSPRADLVRETQIREDKA